MKRWRHSPSSQTLSTANGTTPSCLEPLQLTILFSDDSAGQPLRWLLRISVPTMSATFGSNHSFRYFSCRDYLIPRLHLCKLHFWQWHDCRHNNHCCNTLTHDILSKSPVEVATEAGRPSRGVGN